MDVQLRLQLVARQMGISEEDLPAVLSSLAFEGLTKFERTGSKADIDFAVECARGSIRTVHGDSELLRDRYYNLGTILFRRYERAGAIADLNEAIAAARQTAAYAPEDGPDKGIGLDQLGVFLERQYERTGNMTFLTEATQLARRAVELIPQGHRHRAGCLSNLGDKLRKQYVRTGQRACLDESITLARESVGLLPLDSPSRGTSLNNLGINLMTRYEATSQIADLEDAIAVVRQALDSTPFGHPDRLHSLNSLGHLLGWRFERMDRAADLDEAIEVATQAVDTAPRNHPKRPVYLDNLGTKLARRYERTGQVADLDESIRLIREAVESTPVTYPDRVIWINNLGNALYDKYERTSEMVDLEEAIRLARLVLDLTPQNHLDRAGWLNNLGIKLEERYKRTVQLADLEEAINVTRQAIEATRQATGLTPDDHTDWPSWLNNLGNKLEMRYNHTGQDADLEEAIRVAREAVSLTPSNHPSKSTYLSNLGSKLLQQYQQPGQSAGLEEAIEVSRQGVDSMPEGHPQRAQRLLQLEAALEKRYKQTGQQADLAESCSCLLEAWQCQISVPIYRIRAGARCLKLLALQGRVSAAIQLGKEIIDFLPAVNTKSLDRDDQQFVMSTFSGIAADVCSLLLADGQPLDALECLEKGRAVIIGQLVDARSDLSSLLEQCPEIAQRYERLRDEVNAPLGRFENSASGTRVANRRREAVAELNACIQEIRGIAGNERFLLGQTAAEMQQCAVGGTIVVVNITTFRSDAILVSAGAIKTIDLPGLSAQDAKSWLSKKWRGPKGEMARKNMEYLQYLDWLWNVCVKPVLDDVCGTGDVAKSQPRIWWIGTGLGSSMPFHAAGIHSPGSRENAYRRAVSSYTPSIKALGHARHRARASNTAQGSLLVVAMPTTPGHIGDLPGVTDEKARVTGIVDSRMPVEVLDLPSVDEVVDKLQNCRVAHFACHGSTDHANPSNSGLILQKQADGGGAEQDRLTVQRISELSLDRACIAYLSACSTAENKAARLSDEVIHVVSGFQVAGFPHVVGCLWPSKDDVCVDIAGEFYRLLLQQGVAGWDGRAVAAALQGAVIALRETSMSRPLLWAQFVHYGA